MQFDETELCYNLLYNYKAGNQDNVLILPIAPDEHTTTLKECRCITMDAKALGALQSKFDLSSTDGHIKAFSYAEDYKAALVRENAHMTMLQVAILSKQRAAKPEEYSSLTNANRMLSVHQEKLSRLIEEEKSNARATTSNQSKPLLSSFHDAHASLLEYQEQHATAHVPNMIAKHIFEDVPLSRFACLHKELAFTMGAIPLTRLKADAEKNNDPMAVYQAEDVGLRNSEHGLQEDLIAFHRVEWKSVRPIESIVQSNATPRRSIYNHVAAIAIVVDGNTGKLKENKIYVTSNMGAILKNYVGEFKDGNSLPSALYIGVQRPPPISAP